MKVSRPSEALAAIAAADQAFTGLMLGLGAVALLVGGVGVANTMVISVLERRGELWTTLGGLAATILVGVIAGLYPAVRAAGLSPTEALAVP